jgi:hypothetical protein
MAINSDDFIGSLMNEQARLNSIVDDGDINTLVADISVIADPIGVGSTETLTPTATHPPHLWDEGANTLWGFFSWS